ncbi:hypothetical protein KC338_g181 [Hortaea werneckii]|nr:hypothetical protein KC338_g181 [Hortaea werneckii]
MQKPLNVSLAAKRHQESMISGGSNTDVIRASASRNSTNTGNMSSSLYNRTSATCRQLIQLLLTLALVVGLPVGWVVQCLLRGCRSRDPRAMGVSACYWNCYYSDTPSRFIVLSDPRARDNFCLLLIPAAEKNELDSLLPTSLTSSSLSPSRKSTQRLCPCGGLMPLRGRREILFSEITTTPSLLTFLWTLLWTLLWQKANLRRRVEWFLPPIALSAMKWRAPGRRQRICGLVYSEFASDGPGMCP